MTNLIARIHLFVLNLREERGQDLIEYALFGGLLATAIIAVATFILLAPANNPVNTLLDGIEGCIDFQAGGCNPF
jgi:Flp pilus assembly pilin Flp